MSFILDAIARSERERQQREAPALRSLATPALMPAAPRRRNTVVFATAILLINAIILTVWMQFWHEPAEQSQAASTPSTTVSVPAMAQPLIQPNEQLASTSSSTFAATVNQPAATPALAPPADTAAPATIVVAPAQPVDSDEQAVNSSDETGDWVRIGPETLASRTRDQSRRQAPANGVRVQSTAELPESVRRVLPTLVFSGHLYSSDAASSLVFVDGGRPVTSGQRIIDDVFLNEITPTGVVVEFRGYLISVGVLQNWTLN